MAEGSRYEAVKPYQFEPVVDLDYSDNKDDMSESETDIREQASFTERLGRIDWCSCMNCTPMSSGIEYRCCREVEAVEEKLTEGNDLNCITNSKQFKIVCLNKEVLYTALVTMKTVRGDPLHLPLSNR